MRIGAEVIVPEGTSVDTQAPTGAIAFRVHSHRDTNQRAVVVVNTTEHPRRYLWKFTHRQVKQAKLYAPFEPVRDVSDDKPMEIKGEGLHILVESA